MSFLPERLRVIQRALQQFGAFLDAEGRGGRGFDAHRESGDGVGEVDVFEHTDPLIGLEGAMQEGVEEGTGLPGCRDPL